MTRSFVKEVAVDLDLEDSWLPAPPQSQLRGRHRHQSSRLPLRTLAP